MLLETTRNRYLRIILTGILLLALFPICSAYADDFEGGDGGSHNIGGSYPSFGTVWFEKKGVANSPGISKYRYGVVAYTNWDAAMYCMFGDELDFQTLSAKKRVKLLKGSAFTSFANLFHTGKPDLTDDWSGDAGITLAWNSAKELYGETYCYSVIYPYDKYEAAVTFARKVLAEDDDMPSSPSVPDDEVGDYNDGNNDLVMIPVSLWAPNDYYMPVSYVAVHRDVYNGMMQYVTDDDSFIFAGLCGGPEHDYYYAFVGVKYNSGGSLVKKESSNTPYDLYADGRVYIRYLMNYAWVDGQYNGGNYVTVTATSLNYFPSLAKTDDYFSNWWPWWYISGVPDGDVEPPIEWPDPPTTVAPTPPDVPTPGDPTVPVQPDPPTPTPPNPWLPIPDVDIDITGEDFQDLIDALDEHCKHLQQSIQSNISQLWNLQSGFFESQFNDLFDMLDNSFSWLGNDVIVTSFGDLKSYLKELFDWLAERMDFNIQLEGGQYDDTSVIYWLKKIWSKMGEGINTQPVDPVSDSDDWWAWLLALMGNFVAMLLAFGSDRLADVTNSLQTLTGKFPFSLPWDLAALYALLDAPAVIPEFDLPCFSLTSSGLSEVGTYHITLEPYDSLWDGVRWVERVGFGVMLIKSTNLFTGLLRKAVGND